MKNIISLTLVALLTACAFPVNPNDPGYTEVGGSESTGGSSSSVSKPRIDEGFPIHPVWSGGAPSEIAGSPSMETGGTNSMSETSSSVSKPRMDEGFPIHPVWGGSAGEGPTSTGGVGKCGGYPMDPQAGAAS